ncbi:PREDICTED: nucleotide exchange factor SIL1 [Ceratosolen solmsi marchali]|uniref:Nucleotide exchange factor SIL1 n=1 Tax=Ceratosolen solmsi marchali TaxID=326594 RepID=A0AAJ6YWD3_9HYME|nr:PREDICTED: nucleotide exchange factor SIL1 [Ceratosolen solmsi marchali]
MRYFTSLLLVIFYFTVSAIAIDSNKNVSVFLPTKDWQTVKKGTLIPPGLHVRHNLQTGVTEAKLMDEKQVENSEEKPSKSEQNSLTIHPDKPLINEENDVKKGEQNDRVNINFDELKGLLKEMNSGDTGTLLQSEYINKDQPERRKKFKHYSELKEELETLNMNISTDSEVLTSLFNEFESYKEFIITDNLDTIKIQDVLEILNNIEYLIHQIDNAQIFSDMGGMSKIISPCLNSTNSEVKAEALKLLGAAVQSNPKVQFKALENDYVQKLLHMLSVNNKIEVKSRCLFALGALVRHFPAAQKTLVNNGGLEIFGKLLTDGHFQIQIRVMNLVNDLTIERKHLNEIEDDKQKLKIKEYNLTNFEHKLLMQKYCQNLVDLMIKSLKINSEIDDFHEIVYESMITLSVICKNEYIDKKEVLLREIQKLLITYRDSSKINENNVNLNSSQQNLLEKLQNIISKRHDEL